MVSCILFTPCSHSVCVAAVGKCLETTVQLSAPPGLEEPNIVSDSSSPLSLVGML